MTPDARIRILCVDDEPSVLDGLARNLRQRYALETAGGGEEGLEILQRKGPFSVVVSDLRMPGMNGIVFLTRVRGLPPDTVPILLTGQADLEAAIAAVNDGHIFRLLSKPCPTATLLKALEAGVEQYRLVIAERVLLEKTLHGIIKALVEILAMVHPAAFGRATRAQQSVRELANHFDIRDRWPVEVAALLSQIGCVALPPATVEKLYRGGLLSGTEQPMVDRLPTVVQQLLAHIPRLEPVREILLCQGKGYGGEGSPHDGLRGEAIPWGARALKAVLDLDVLETQGLPAQEAIEVLRGREGGYDPKIIGALACIRGNSLRTANVKELPLDGLRLGMVFAEDVTTPTGLLLVAKGQEVTPGLLERIRNFSISLGVKEPIRAIVGGKLT